MQQRPSVGAVTTSGTTTTIGQGYYRDYSTGLQNGVTYTYKFTLGYDGVGKKKTASQKVKADIPAPGSTITTAITAADFEVKAYKTRFSTDADANKILDAMDVKMKNFDPRFSYSIDIYQNDDWETGDDYDPTEGDSLNTSAGIFNISNFYSLSPTVTVSFNATTPYDPDLKQRVVITYTVNSDLHYKVATHSDTKKGLNTIVLNLTK